MLFRDVPKPLYCPARYRPCNKMKEKGGVFGKSRRGIKLSGIPMQGEPQTGKGLEASSSRSTACQRTAEVHAGKHACAKEGQ